MSKYFKKNKEAFTYPEQMEIILEYLYRHGEITGQLAKIEELYKKFSLDCYDMSWMCVTERDVTLEKFAEWLDNLEDDEND